VGTDGAALAAGIAAKQTTSAETLDCLERVLKSGTYPTPGSWPAKVSFEL
jgi:hypothetical protein